MSPHPAPRRLLITLLRGLHLPKQYNYYKDQLVSSVQGHHLHTKQQKEATTGSRGQNPLLKAGGHGLSIQLLTSGRYTLMIVSKI